MALFATLSELMNRLDWTLDPSEERIAAAALEDASELARGHGKNWVDAASAPRLVRTLVLSACVRYMKNPESYILSRAGDETVQWEGQGQNAGVVHFTEDERKLLAALGGKSSIFSVPVNAWRTQPRSYRDQGYVPAADGTKPIPMFNSDTGPW